MKKNSRAQNIRRNAKVYSALYNGGVNEQDAVFIATHEGCSCRHWLAKVAPNTYLGVFSDECGGTGVSVGVYTEPQARETAADYRKDDRWAVEREWQ